MSFPLTLLDLAGSVGLVLWGVHMVQTGLQRGFGTRLGTSPGRTLRNRFTVFLARLGMTAVSQSSTATGLNSHRFHRRRIGRPCSSARLLCRYQGSGTISPVLYGIIGDAAGASWATVAIAMVTLAIFPLAFALAPRLARRGRSG
jgi:hypothetical protein